MGQYNRIKAKYPDAILLFRVGDFYETFGADAVKAADALGIVLTNRANGSSRTELAGFPHHAMDTYLPKLVKAGYRVAICDQLEDPKKTKTIVKRGVTELVTPGVAHNDQILENKSNNFLAALHIGKDRHGMAFIDISTGEFLVTEGNDAQVDKLLQSFQPAELIFSRSQQREYQKRFPSKFYTYALEDWAFQYDFGRENLLEHFQTNSLKGFGIEDQEQGIIAAGAILHYLSETEHKNLQHVNNISRLAEDRYVWLDKFSIRNLELIYSPQEGATTLFDVVDRTSSPMGARTLKKWIVLPLKDMRAIQERHAGVEYFIKNPEERSLIKQQIKAIGDLERLITKVPMAKIGPREVVQLKFSLEAIKPIVETLSAGGPESLKKAADQLNPCQQLIDKIEREVKDDSPAVLAKGDVIEEGVSADLDELRTIIRSGKEVILDIQQREAERTGISSLKIGFNNVFGYYLEVTNAHKDKVPEEWIRKQTLTNSERYITAELKELEEKILGADEKIKAIEEQLYLALVAFIGDYIEPIQLNARIIGELDCLASFAELALKETWVKPEIDESLIIDIKEGRHPVIEQQLPDGEQYVPNNVYLDNNDQQIIMITGPNMSGKSAVLRQTALITLLAQMGSFVPAKSARIGIVDKIFTRVGASDNISSGESTFMVEMNETASIVNNISERSLILLDEIGRGTSTYDGISIAWSIAEYLHQSGQRPKTLFATHYHELNELAGKYERIKNYNIATREVNDQVIFLRKLVPGGSKSSFGIHVANMAGMPKEIVARAEDLLRQLEKKSIEQGSIREEVKQIKPQDNFQLSIFEAQNPTTARIMDVLREVDVNATTPVEALMKINELKKILEELS